GLQRRADDVFVLDSAGLWVQAANAYPAAVRGAQAFENLDGAGFPGAIRAEQAKDFAFVDGKADAAQGFDVAVALGQVLHFDGRGSPHGPIRYNTIRSLGANGVSAPALIQLVLQRPPAFGVGSFTRLSQVAEKIESEQVLVAQPLLAVRVLQL